MRNKHHGDKNESARQVDPMDQDPRHGSPSSQENENESPARTTSHGWMTTPKFGSSTSGGGEIEPGPERD